MCDIGQGPQPLPVQHLLWCNHMLIFCRHFITMADSNQELTVTLGEDITGVTTRIRVRDSHRLRDIRLFNGDSKGLKNRQISLPFNVWIYFCNVLIPFITNIFSTAPWTPPEKKRAPLPSKPLCEGTTVEFPDTGEFRVQSSVQYAVYHTAQKDTDVLRS